LQPVWAEGSTLGGHPSPSRTGCKQPVAPSVMLFQGSVSGCARPGGSCDPAQTGRGGERGLTSPSSASLPSCKSSIRASRNDGKCEAVPPSARGVLLGRRLRTTGLAMAVGRRARMGPEEVQGAGSFAGTPWASREERPHSPCVGFPSVSSGTVRRRANDSEIGRVHRGVADSNRPVAGTSVGDSVVNPGAARSCPPSGPEPIFPPAPPTTEHLACQRHHPPARLAHHARKACSGREIRPHPFLRESGLTGAGRADWASGTRSDASIG